MEKNGEKKYENVSVKRLEHSEIEIDGEIKASVLDFWYKEVLKNAAKNADIAGFRTGKAPEELVEKQMGQMKILEKAAESAIDKVYPIIIEEVLSKENIRPIGTPVIAATKLALGNPLGFKAKTSIFPEVKIDDYKKIAEGVPRENDPAVLEKDIDAVIEDLRKTSEFQEINDEFAKKFGDFKNVQEMRLKISENILNEKKREIKEKRRGSIAEKLIAASEIDVPEILVESELDTMVGRFRHDVEQAGMTLENYLSKIEKTEDEIRRDWHESAVKRARLELILAYIARKENISPDEERVKKEMEHILSHHKDADRFRARMFVEHMLQNEKVLEFLENL